MTLTLEEFLRRFLQHILPKGFPRIRYFGWMAHRCRRVLLPICKALLHVSFPTDSSSSQDANQSITWKCPNCQGPMYVVQRLTVVEILREQPGRRDFVDTS